VQWRRIEQLVTGKEGDKGRHGEDNRLFVVLDGATPTALIRAVSELFAERRLGQMMGGRLGRVRVVRG
jgi:hypothetical protein